MILRADYSYNYILYFFANMDSAFTIGSLKLVHF